MTAFLALSGCRLKRGKAAIARTTRFGSERPGTDIGPEFRNGVRRRCHWSVRNSARSELAVLVQPPARRPARTFIIHVYSGGSLKSAAVVIANLGKSRASVAEFRAN